MSEAESGRVRTSANREPAPANRENLPEGPALQGPQVGLGRALIAPQGIPPADVIALQRTVGNQRVSRMIQGGSRSRPARRSPSRRGSTAARVQLFGERQHAGIEQEALAGSFSPEEMRDIAFGNWANDFNQISLAGDFLRDRAGVDIPNSDLFQIAQIIAEAQFGETIARRMTAARFGAYDPRQHFDNPATDPNAPLGVQAVAPYIGSTREHIRQTFVEAITAQDPAVGRQYYGSALHIMEDFFAHTNFVEIALRLKGVQDVDPQGGTVTEAGGQERDRLVAGMFATADTVVSIVHIITNHLQRPPQPNEGPLNTSDRIALVLLRRQNRALAAAYEGFCHVNYAARRLIPGYEAVHNQIQAFKAAQAAQWGRAIAAANSILAQQSTGTGAQPSHSRLNKDDPTSTHYQLARELASHVVRTINPHMRTIFSVPVSERPRECRPGAETEFSPVAQAENTVFELVDRYTQHPDQCDWWHAIVERYAQRLGSRR